MKRAAVLALAVLAASCSEKAAGPAAQGEAAAGEVLGGSISDAMIPLEQLDSQAPLAPRQGPAVSDIDADQPEVAPAEGVEAVPQSTEAEPATAVPAPEAPTAE